MTSISKNMSAQNIINQFYSWDKHNELFKVQLVGGNILVDLNNLILWYL